jgi:hypothetical protein
MRELDLTAVRNRRLKTQALEDAYKNSGFSGCFLPEDGGERGATAKYERDRFRSSAGNDRYKASSVLPVRGADEEPGFNGVPGCHVYSAYAFEEFSKYRPPAMPDWLFKMLQNSGCCVGASWEQIMNYLMGCISRDASNRFQMFLLVAMVVYAYRKGCGQGWYMGSCAAEAREHGLLFAGILDGRQVGEMPFLNYRELNISTEQRQEDAAVKWWCNGRVPNEIENWMQSHFQYHDRAITELDSTDGDLILAIAADQACFHHGSNYTAGRGGLDTVRKIGGHAQGGEGADASDECIAWFRSRGVNCSKRNFILKQGQTWGGGWSGEIDDEDHPFGTDMSGHTYNWAEVLDAAREPSKLQDIVSSCRESGGWGWGPKPQGEWIVTLDTFRARFSRNCYVYRPMFDGIPGKDPEPPQPPSVEHPPIEGTVFVEMVDGVPIIRGIPELVVPAGLAPGRYRYVIPSNGDDTYRFEPFLW